MKTALGWLVGLGILGIFFSAGGQSANGDMVEAVEPTCLTEEIAYEEEVEESEDDDLGEEFVSQDGELGERRVCSLDGKVVSNDVITPPIAQVTKIGTYEEPYEEPVYSYRVGAWCNDGSWSNATGRGACSWHGGVSEWVYE